MGNKIVYNSCYGGFCPSEAAMEAFREITEIDVEYGHEMRKYRAHPVFVGIVEELGAAANTNFSDLEVAEIPGTKYYIQEYDGIETVLFPEMDSWEEIENV